MLDTMPDGLVGIIVIAVIVILILSLFFRFVPVGLWITAYFSGVKLKISNLVGMRLRRVSPSMIVQPMIKATKAGLNIDINELEAHYLAGGDINLENTMKKIISQCNPLKYLFDCIIQHKINYT